ncbi:hypothetical protein MTR67_031653 [Solanum verrucosum]|uniref:Reverse transcriptase domain-containing protein n=1 Tax=Solanum verrucosum TaxID=315347 RepID=A0AAF0ZGK2_SOLVR|nr:hypothetical protein MTR67_031653 [Solanum verrucosum]
MSEEENESPCRQPVIDEVKSAVFNLNGDSASGPDGLTGRFYQTCWHIVGNDVLKMVQEFFKVLINGQSHGFFHSTRGVKLKDPLSHVLFILSAEVLSRSLNALFENDLYVSYGMPKWSTPINHLAYADDTIIFAATNIYSLKKIISVLQAYEKESGRKINKEKVFSICIKMQ